MSDKSQHSECTYIAHLIHKKKLSIPKTFIDIGAADGITISNSFYFIKANWKAVLVEPLPKYFEKIVELYRTNGNVKEYNFAISNISGKVKFHRQDTHSHISDKGVEVNSITYPELLKISGYEKKEIGILSIDVEGKEIEIISQMLQTSNLPKILIIESNTPQERTIQMDLLSMDYDLVNVLLVNTIWIKKGLIKRFT